MRATFYGDTGELVVYAEREELRLLGERLRDPAGGSFQLEPQRGAEEEGVEMHMVRIRAEDGDANVSVDGDVIVITGSVARLSRLGSAIETLDDEDWNDPGSHAHFEPDDGTPVLSFLARGSCSLIVAGPVPDEPGPVS
jgi:hypothetical protein